MRMEIQLNGDDILEVLRSKVEAFTNLELRNAALARTIEEMSKNGETPEEGSDAESGQEEISI